MPLPTNASVIIDGTVILNKMGVTYVGEDDLADPIILDDGVDSKQKTNVPGFILDYVPKIGITEPDWSSFNGKLAVIQSESGENRAYSGITLRGVGNYKEARDGGDTSKTVEFFAQTLNKS